MEHDKILEVLGIIAEGQNKLPDQFGCEAPVKLSVGAVAEDGQCCHDVIVIMECPATTIKRLQKAGFTVSMSKEFRGLCVDYY